MPNTKSAERRMRNSARKNLRNRSAKSRLHTLEKSYLELLSAGKKDDAAKELRSLSSAFDKPPSRASCIALPPTARNRV